MKCRIYLWRGLSGGRQALQVGGKAELNGGAERFRLKASAQIYNVTQPTAAAAE